MRYAGWIVAAVAILAAVHGAIRVSALSEELAAANTEAAELEAHISELEADREQSATGGAEERVARVSAPDSEYVWPIAESDTWLTSPYGVRVSPFGEDREVHHTGVDIAGVWRAQVVAIADGTVTEHWPPPGTPYPGGGSFRGHETYGGMVRIRHDSGAETLYAHLSWTRVHQGMRVAAGEVIGRQGATGRADGAHLHLEMRVDGERVNPLRYLGGRELEGGS